MPRAAGRPMLRDMDTKHVLEHWNNAIPLAVRSVAAVMAAALILGFATFGVLAATWPTAAPLSNRELSVVPVAPHDPYRDSGETSRTNPRQASLSMVEPARTRQEERRRGDIQMAQSGSWPGVSQLEWPIQRELSTRSGRFLLTGQRASSAEATSAAI